VSRAAGDLLVVCAQMFTALQFILEEKFLVQYKVGAGGVPQRWRGGGGLPRGMLWHAR
jgi:hypothetical protein